MREIDLAPGLRKTRRRAFAKVNYSLDIGDVRPDGYHEVATVMQTISLADDLTATTGSGLGVTLTCSGTPVPDGPENLASRGVLAALEAAGCTQGVRLALNKLIPAEAGLGGGSSDAASAMLAVCTLLDLDVPPESLTVTASQLGCDVPFFLTGGTALVTGRGERIVPLADSPALWFVIVKPEPGMPTSWAYRELDKTPDRRLSPGTSAVVEAITRGDATALAARMCNDFEAIVHDADPRVARVRQALQDAGARVVRLCGSGSAHFGVALTEEEAREVASRVPADVGTVFVCRTVGHDEAAVG